MKKEIYELIKIVKEDIEIHNKLLREKKSSINADYLLAKLDFIVIENYEDHIETLEKVLTDLEKCQERIKERNNRRVI